ncbi:hypothetical protein T12_2935 [Trichinella patagoniensis]|uniref:Uncharacterized protein n=1 Tax=Trichinella patagoniensis TaxID=990121 RepID=A0A0V1A4W8_9BILA|nr:hypothetical protein T12_2935 [Trichinella patagoniensis]
MNRIVKITLWLLQQRDHYMAQLKALTGCNKQSYSRKVFTTLKNFLFKQQILTIFHSATISHLAKMLVDVYY